MYLMVTDLMPSPKIRNKTSMSNLPMPTKHSTESIYQSSKVRKGNKSHWERRKVTVCIQIHEKTHTKKLLEFISLTKSQDTGSTHRYQPHCYKLQ